MGLKLQRLANIAELLAGRILNCLGAGSGVLQDWAVRDGGLTIRLVLLWTMCVGVCSVRSILSGDYEIPQWNWPGRPGRLL